MRWNCFYIGISQLRGDCKYRLRDSPTGLFVQTVIKAHSFAQYFHKNRRDGGMVIPTQTSHISFKEAEQCAAWVSTLACSISLMVPIVPAPDMSVYVRRRPIPVAGPLLHIHMYITRFIHL